MFWKVMNPHVSFTAPGSWQALDLVVGAVSAHRSPVSNDGMVSCKCTWQNWQMSVNANRKHQIFLIQFNLYLETKLYKRAEKNTLHITNNFYMHQLWVIPDMGRHRSPAHSPPWRHGTVQICVPSHESLCFGGLLYQSRMGWGPSHLGKKRWSVTGNITYVKWQNQNNTNQAPKNLKPQSDIRFIIEKEALWFQKNQYNKHYKNCVL